MAYNSKECNHEQTYLLAPVSQRSQDSERESGSDRLRYIADKVFWADCFIMRPLITAVQDQPQNLFLRKIPKSLLDVVL